MSYIIGIVVLTVSAVVLYFSLTSIRKGRQRKTELEAMSERQEAFKRRIEEIEARLSEKMSKDK